MDRLAVIKQLREVGVKAYTREEWGSVRPEAYIVRRGTHPMPAGRAKYHFLHITVTADTDTVQEGWRGAKQIESYGLSTPKMVSYQDMITNEGLYFQGQDYGTKGTHTINDRNVANFANDLNLQGYALAILQNVEDEVTDVQVLLAARVFAARELAGFVNKFAPIYPHRKFAYKACPGDKAVARLAEIQELKDNMVQRGSLKEIPPLPTRGIRVDTAIQTLRETGAKGDGKRAKAVKKARRLLNKIKPI